MRARIDSIIIKYLKAKNLNSDILYSIEYPKQEEFGDYSTNIAMLLSKQLKKKPYLIAEEFRDMALDENLFERIEIAGPGFINFYIKNSVFIEEIEKINNDTSGYFRPNVKKQKIQVEFVSANPTGPLHIGHGRGAAIGDSISRILKFAGHDVEKEYYINDAGLQMRMLGISTFIRYKQLMGMSEDIPKNGYRGEYIIDIAKDIMAEYGSNLLNKNEDESISICMEKSSEVILKDILNTLSNFRVSFDNFFKEKRLFDSNEVENSISFLKDKNLIYEKDGALWFKTTNFGDDKDRVLKKSNGDYTYFASDIAYHKNKFITRKFDRVIDIWGADHHGYVKRMKSAVSALGIDSDNLNVILIQIVNLLRDGEKLSMSTRKAEFVELDKVLEEAGVDAARFMFLLRSVDSHLDFDVYLAKKQSSENPVFYAQYAYARISNIFAQLDKNYEITNKNLSLLSDKYEINLIKSVVKFKDYIKKAHDELEPYHIARGILEIAEKLHKFYNHIRVIGQESNLMDARLALLDAVAKTLKLGFDLIGIEAKKKM